MKNLGYQDRNPGIINRPRLVEKLQSACGRRLTVISAPAGYGKTTLATQFLHQSYCPVAWHTIGERERDVPDLHTQSLKALADIAPGIDTLTDRGNRSPTELAALVADYLRNTLTNDAIYMLDDVHSLAGAPGAEAWLQALISYLPPICHTVLISRSVPQLPLEMLSRGQVMILRQNELRLTPQEIQSLAVETLGADLPPAELSTLEARLEGWPVGIALALAPQSTETQELWGEKSGSEALFKGLASLMFNAQPLDIRHFLLASSTLNRLTPELCGMLGLSQSQRMLAEIQARNLFLNPAPGGLVFHMLFRDFLQDRLKTTSIGEYTRLHATAARWFEARHDEDEAFNHYVSAGEAPQASAIAEQVAQSYFVEGKTETLLRWNTALKTIGGHSPRVLYNCGIIYADRYEYAAASIQLDEAERLTVTNSESIEAGGINVQRAKISLDRGDYLSAIVQVESLLQDFAEASNIRRQALNIKGLANLRLGKAQEAIRILEEAVPMYRAEADNHSLSQILQTVSFAYRRVGRLAEARASLQEVVAIQRSLGGARSLATALNNLGYHYHLSGDYRQAQITLEEGLNLVIRYPDRRAETFLLNTLGNLLRDLNDLDAALSLYYKALGLLGDGEPSLHCLTLISISTLRRWQQRNDEAITLASEAVNLARKHNLEMEHDLAIAALWTARASADDVHPSLTQLEEVAMRLAGRNATVERLRVLAWAYEIAQHSNLLSVAAQYFNIARNVALEFGSGQPFVVEAQHSIPALKQQHGNEPLAHDLGLLRQAQLQYSAQSTRTGDILSTATYSLRITTLGQEAVMRDGRTIPLSAFHTSNARELFFYILFNGPNSRELISLAFWPDSSSSQVRSSFHTTLYRARDAVGENTIAYEGDLYLINPMIDVWCDAHEFESLVRQARPLSSRDARTEDLWRRAIALYKGDFLTSVDMEWVLSYREYLRELFIEALVGLGTCALNRSDAPDALGHFSQALRLEPYREDIHRSVMACYAQQSDRQKINAHLREMKKLFRKDLKAEPSTETLIFVKNLLNKL